ncbi:MAG: DUF1800 family protein [Opitutales bacterium]|nr:DUF1800 family protein [Opitutales bacterium]
MDFRNRHFGGRLGFAVRLSGEATSTGGPDSLLQAALGEIHPMPGTAGSPGMGYAERGNPPGASAEDELDRRTRRQQMQRREREAYAAYGLEWLAFARDPRHSAKEKLVLFFQNVWVVAFQGVRTASALRDYHARIRGGLGGSYPALCKSLARSPAMVRCLNLNQSRKGAPNENFARELFELFTLGEGNYSEQDVKEAARALTGYTFASDGAVRFVRGRHDAGVKTIFGQRGAFDLDGLIDLIFRQSAAARFLPNELARFYLAEEGLPDEVLAPLAEGWRASGYSIPWLVRAFFNADVFHDERYRGNLIKSPIHFYLGLLQDLDLDVFPSPRLSLNPLRTMGQAFFNPPNVRGWVGGRQWISSATLAARTQLVHALFEDPRRLRLNADEEEALARARAAGKGRFTVDPQWLAELGRMDDAELARVLAERLHADPQPEALQPLLREVAAGLRGRARGIACLTIALCCPAYHLC